MVRRTDPVSIR